MTEQFQNAATRQPQMTVINDTVSMISYFFYKFTTKNRLLPLK